MSAREVHYGIVSDNADPEMRGRVRVRCGTLVPDDTEWPDWVEPLFAYLSSSDQNKTDGGWFFIPDIGVVVELEVAVTSARDEVPGQTSIDAPDIRWRACVWAHGEDVIPDEFATNYPDRRGFKTGRGHIFLFDDTEDSELFKLLVHGSADVGVEVTPSGWNVTTPLFSIANGGLGPKAVIFEGADGFQGQLAGALTEISGYLGGLGLACTSTIAFIAKLQAGSYASTLTVTE